jgi:hypothetical protein
VRARAFAALAAAGALAATGCGKSGGDSAKRDYARKADAICAKGNKAVQPYEKQLATLTGQAGANRFFRDAPGVIRKASRETSRYIDQLAALERPAGDAQALGAWIADVRKQVRLLGQTADAIEAKDAQRAQALTHDANALDKKNNAFARSYGMKTCSKSA